MSTAASPRLEISTRGGYGSHSPSCRDRLEQQVAVRADAAAEHDQLDVGDRGDRRDVQRDAARLFRDDLRARAGPRCGRRRRSGGLVRRQQRRPSVQRGASSLGERATAPARTGRAPPDAGQRVVELTGRAVWPRCSSPRSTSPEPMPVPTERKAKSSMPRAMPRHCSPSAARLMSFSSSPARRAAARARRRSLAPRARGRSSARAPAAAGSTTPGTPTTAPSTAGDGPGRREQRVVQRRDRREHRVRVEPASSTSWRARTSPRGR